MAGPRPLLEALGRQGGQSAVEYVGALTVVLVLMLALAHLDVEERLVADLGGQICEAVLDAPCRGSARHIARAELATLAPCPTRTAASEETVTVTALARAGTGDRAVLEEASDGTTTVTFVDSASLGAETGVGASFRLQRASGPSGVGLRAEAGAALEFGEGRSYRFPTPERAVAFFRRFGPEESFGGELRNRLVGGCLACRLVGVKSAELPDPDATFVEGGGSAGGAAALEVGPAGAGLEALVRSAIGRRVDHTTGDRTYYYRLNGEGSATAAALLGIGELEAGARARLEGAVELTVSDGGTPLELTVRSAMASSAAADLGLAAQSAAAGSLGEPPAGGGAGSATSGGGNGRMVEVEGTLDLRRDVLSREAALRLVEALRPVANPLQLVEAAGAVRDRIGAVGEIDVRSFATSSGEAGGEVSGAVGGKVGAGLAHATTTELLLDAHTRAAGDDVFVERTDCGDPHT